MINYLSKQIKEHLYDIDNNKITNIEIYIKKYNDFGININNNNNLRCIYPNEYTSYIDKIIYSFIDILAFLETQYNNKLYNIQEYINMKNKYIYYYLISSETEREKKNKISVKKKNNKSSYFSNQFPKTILNTEMNQNLNLDLYSSIFSEWLCSKENTRKRKRNDFDYNC